MSIKSLCESKGFSYEVVARDIGVDPMLIDRIDKGFQPLSIMTARKIAGYIGTDVPSVLAEAPSWTDSTNPISEKPVVLPSLRNPLTAVKYQEQQVALDTGALPTPQPPATMLVVARNTGAGDTQIFRVDRTTGAKSGMITVAGVNEFRGFGFVNDYVWAADRTVGSRKPRSFYPFNVPISANIVGSSFTDPVAVESVDATRHVYVADAVRIMRVNQATGTFPVSAQIPGYEPIAMVQYGQYLITLWPKTAGATDAYVSIFDADLNTITSDVFAIPGAKDIGVGGGSIWVVGGVGATAGVWKISMDLHTVTQLYGSPIVQEPTGVLWYAGKIYVCDVTATEHVFMQFDEISLIASQTYLGRGPFSRPKADPPYVWVADPNTPLNAPLRKFSPAGLVEVLTVPLYETHPITTSGATAWAVIPFGAVGPSPV